MIVVYMGMGYRRKKKRGGSLQTKSKIVNNLDKLQQEYNDL